MRFRDSGVEGSGSVGGGTYSSYTISKLQRSVSSTMSSRAAAMRRESARSEREGRRCTCGESVLVLGLWGGVG